MVRLSRGHFIPYYYLHLVEIEHFVYYCVKDFGVNACGRSCFTLVSMRFFVDDE